jgi:uncharacterized protein
MNHLRHAGASAETQQAVLAGIVRASPGLMRALTALRDLDLPDWHIVAGAIYNQVWNHLTGRPDMFGVKDIDLFYFDPDTSWEAEDRVIRRVAAVVPGQPPVEARNQARVHLWFAHRFGVSCPAYEDALQPVSNFATRCHSIAIRLDAAGDFRVHAPFGLDDVFSFRMAPNPALPNRATHEAKGQRQLAIRPEVTLVPWPEHAA